jgi:acyl transferase domain-containing protein/NADPH:quinone reductase-like Zn-dependent oxidoreductase/NAD(P)-dependent dehydrogenase (short-subunit alcohol dehydrogenase family)/acyl carrier protein
MKEPLAIIGMACRFPGGADSPEKFWNLLLSKTDGIHPIPPERWDRRKFVSRIDSKPGKAHVDVGGFLQEDISLFDPLFFGISPREAECLDPQQRYLLMVTWEAMEDAGIPLETFQRARTGVFVGGFCLDNKLLQLSPFNRQLIDTNTPTSSTMAILANRVSYIFDLKGPSFTVDTACSSSLVATHLGCQSLWTGESDLAIVAGVNIMFMPEYPITMSKGKFLSKHGRCKAFDADASGYTRGEGVGVVILKPLSRARADGDRIYSLVRATGINQDGRTPGISLPNEASQEALIRAVCSEAGIAPSRIGYVEAHGTGTQAGDITEATALDRVLGEERAPGEKIPMGSVKTAIGHLEAGAGIAGLIKTALTLKHETIVPNLHFSHPNPAIPFEKMCLQIPIESAAWKKGPEPRLASINSFGYGGTNAHVVLEEAPVPQGAATASDIKGEFLFPLSARSEGALRALAGEYARWIAQETQGSLADMLHSAWMRRSHHSQRIVIRSKDRNELVRRLEAFSQTQVDPRIIAGTAHSGEPHPLVFVYTGMGPQWSGMGRELYRGEEVFRKHVDECDGIFMRIAGWSIRDEMLRDAADSRMHEIHIAQPANFVLQVALTGLLRAQGITPNAVVGHSVGEVAAAFVSGVCTREDALKVIYHRSRLQKMLAGTGTMLAAGIAVPSEAERILSEYPPIDLAAINAPASVTFAGPEAALESVLAELQGKGSFARFLQVEVPYHSRAMDSIREDLVEALSGLTPRSACIPLFSTVTGERLNGMEMGAAYWWDNVRKPVVFARACSTLAREGFLSFLEVGPHPVLRNSLRDCLAAASAKGRFFQTLNRNSPEEETFSRSLAELFVAGFPMIWEPVQRLGDRYTPLPRTVWQKERYWRESEVSKEERLGRPGHVLFQRDLRRAQPAWAVELNEQYFPYLGDHQVNGAPIFPGAAYVEAGLALHREIFGETECVLEDLRFSKMLSVDDERIQMLTSAFDPRTRVFSIHSSYQADQPDWSLHATGRILTGAIAEGLNNGTVDFETLQRSCPEPVDIEALYQRLAQRGLIYGPAFRTLTSLQRGDGCCLAELTHPSGPLGHRVADGSPLNDPSEEFYLIHPGVLDGGFQSFAALVECLIPGETRPWVPVQIERVHFFKPPPAQVWTYVQLTAKTENTLTGTLELRGCDGEIYARLCGLKYQVLRGPSSTAKVPLSALLYREQWNEAATPKASASDAWAAGAVLTWSSRAYPEILDVFGKELVSDLEEWKRRLQDGSDRRIALVYPRAGLGERPSESVYEAIAPLLELACLPGAAARPAPGDEPIEVMIVTEDAQVVTAGDSPVNLPAAPLWNVAHVLNHELPGLHCRILDKDGQTSWRAVLRETAGDAAETDVAYRRGVRFVKRLSPWPEALEKQMQMRAVLPSRQAVELFLERPGQVESLHYRPVDRREPGPDEVEIRVLSSALNFKDLLKVYAQIGDEALEGTYFGNTLGMELSGRVERVGQGVIDLKPGDGIIAPIPGSFRSFATMPVTYVIPKPPSLSFAEAPNMIGFMTAYHGLVTVARLGAGEKVLIHNGTGGVGLAAIQIARWRGAEIYSTAGTLEKREYLSSIGVKHVYDSRSLKFAEAIRCDTGGYGVDVVLNAIAGDALWVSFNLLAPYGRFIEIGKKDIVENAGLPMKAFNRNVSFAGIDIDRLLAERVPDVQGLLRKLREGFVEGWLQPIPVTAFPASKSADAFRFMAQSKHVGKVVITNDDGELLDVLENVSRSIRPDATYLITGGASGLGLEVAKWLAVRGARHLILLSRGGPRTETARAEIEGLEARGVQVHCAKADVSDAGCLTRALSEALPQMPPLRGVIHGAMVLDDGYLRDLSRERFLNVLAPKIDGAVHLHEATRDLKLDFFILFSSISSIVGNPGQGNYVAANGFLDAFAEFRRAQGFPATAINWGVFSEAGVVARSKDLERMLAHSGIRGLTNEQVLGVLEGAIERSPIRIGAFDVDWEQWATANPESAGSAKFSRLRKLKSTRRPQLEALIEELLPLDSHGRSEVLEARLQDLLASVIRVDPARIAADQPISTFGVDSLMTFELIVAVKDKLGAELTPVDLLNGPTLAKIASLILSRILTEEEELIANIENLTEEELDALLAGEATAGEANR